MPERKTELTLTIEELKLVSAIIDRYTYKYLPNKEEINVISKINEFIIENE